MDNDLDGRLRRLEVLLEQQRAVLDAQAEREKQTYRVVCELRAVMMEAEPDGPPLHEVLAQLIAVIAQNNALVQQALSAIQKQGGT